VRRGDLRRYVRPSSPEVPRIVVILSSDSVNSSLRPWVLGMELQRRDPGDILAIPVEGHGWAYVRDLTRLYRAWIGEPVGRLDELTLARITSAVQAALDL
jgi:mRNA-degrading endonuclease toxin of MazEF toxin-antitoxin module